MYKSLQNKNNLRVQSVDVYDNNLDDDEIDYFDDQISDENLPNLKSQNLSLTEVMERQ